MAYGQGIADRPNEGLKMKTVFTRTLHTADRGDVDLALMMSEDIVLNGIDKLRGHFQELHVTWRKNGTKKEHVPWRQFGFTPYSGNPGPRHKACYDVTLDPVTGEIFACIGGGDGFVIWLIQENAKPQLDLVSKRELSRQESDGLLQAAGTDEKVRRRMILAPMKLAHMGVSIQKLELRKPGPDLEVTATTSDTYKPPIVLNYSLIKRRNRSHPGALFSIN